MDSGNLKDLYAFLAVAQERSFTRAAARLGLSQSTLSHTIRGLETRLGVRLLTRTTRSVAPTEAGEQLLRSVGPKLDEIAADLAAVREYRDKPAGTIRITAIDLVAYFSDRGRLFQADRGRRIGVAVAALGKRAGTGVNVS